MSLLQLSSGYKISFVGDSNVGKTSIITRCNSTMFDQVTTPTVGVSNTQVVIKLDEKKVSLNIWDTAGQERFRSLVPVYLHDTKCIVLVFDISQRSSFESLESWLQEIHNEADSKTQIVVCANKCDLEKDVSISECKKWCEDNDCEFYMTSAATGEGINDMFRGIAQLVTEPKLIPIYPSPNLEPSQGKKCC